MIDSRFKNEQRFVEQRSGFTLIEVMVSISIFIIVMVVATGAVLTAVDANRKAQSLGTITNNLNIAFESMIRDLRTGSTYALTNGGKGVSFKDRDNRPVTYVFSGSAITKGSSISCSNTPTPNPCVVTGQITGTDVDIENVKFDLKGGGASDGLQPLLLLHVKGSAGAGDTKSDFNVQTLITSRTLQGSEL